MLRKQRDEIECEKGIYCQKVKLLVLPINNPLAQGIQCINESVVNSSGSENSIDLSLCGVVDEIWSETYICFWTLLEVVPSVINQHCGYLKS